MTALVGFISAILGAFFSSLLAESKDKKKTYEKLLQCLFLLRLDKNLNNQTKERFCLVKGMNTGRQETFYRQSAVQTVK